MKRIKLIVALGAILVLILVLTFCASISDEDVFAMERRGNVLDFRNDTATVSYNLDKVKYLSYSQSGNGEDAFICSDPEVMEGLFSAMFEAPITMERLGEAGAVGTSGAYPGILLEREVTFSFVMEDGTTLRWIIGLDGALCLVTDECIYLSPSRSIDYTAVSPHLTWFVVTHRDADGNRYDVSADGKTFLYYYPGNPAESFEIPEGIEVVAEKSFCDVKDLKELTFSSTVKTIEGEFFYDIPFERVVIPETVENVLYYIKGANLKELVCAAPMTEFYYVSGPKLERLTLPSTIKEYGAWAFGEQLPALQAIKVYGGEVVLDEAFEAFSKDRVIYIPEGATSFCLDQFTGLSHDTYVYLPDSCETFLVDPGVYLAGAVFTISVPADAQVISNDRCPVSNVRIWRRGTENSPYRVTLEDGAGNRYDLSNDGKTLVYYHKENTGTVFEVPRGVEAVLSGAFVDIPCLKELSFANTVKGIGNIFYTGISLEKIILPSSLTQYETSTFEIHSSTLKYLHIGCKVGGINLNNCESLETLSLANLPSDFGKGYEIRFCTSLQTIWVDGKRPERDPEFERLCAIKNDYPILYLPNGMTHLGLASFATPVNVHLPDSVETVSHLAYQIYPNSGSIDDIVVSVPQSAVITEIPSGEQRMFQVGTIIRRGERTSAQRQEIEDAWLEAYGYVPKWLDLSDISSRHYGLRDYGTYNGYTILFCPGSRVASEGYRFYLNQSLYMEYSASFEVLAYRDGEFYEVTPLYTKGELGAEDIARVARMHETTQRIIGMQKELDNPYLYYGKTFSDENESLALELLDSRGVTPTGTYCGIYGIAVVYGDESRLRIDGYQMVGGVALPIGWDSFTVYWRDKTYTLAEAFEKGLLTTENIRTVAWNYYGETASRELPTHNEYPPVFPDIPGVEPLSDEMVEEITEVWRSMYGYRAQWFNVDEITTRHFGLRYYGTYDGYVILYAPEILMGQQIYPYSEKFIAYRDGRIRLLTELCGEGKIDPGVVDLVKRLHTDLETELLSREDLDDPSYYGEQNLPPLGEYPKQLMEQWGFKSSGAGYLGTYNGCVIMAWSTNLRASYYVVIGGVEFDVGRDNFYAYKDGKEMPLWDAFNQGLLNTDEMRAIAGYRHRERSR